MNKSISNKEANNLIDVFSENKELKRENAIMKAVIDTLKSQGFESEIKYIEHKIKNSFKKLKK